MLREAKNKNDIKGYNYILSENKIARIDKIDSLIWYHYEERLDNENLGFRLYDVDKLLRFMLSRKHEQLTDVKSRKYFDDK